MTNPLEARDETAGGPIAESPKDEKPRYAAIIRAYEATSLLQKVIGKLEAQTYPPEKIIIVDSSRDATVRREFERLATDVVIYPDGEFNFSKAINVGVAANELPWTMIISSHVLLDERFAVERGWSAVKAYDADVICWINTTGHAPDAKPVEIDRRRFTGRNGLSNSAGFVRTSLLRDRPFREEVFSAEDQEWSKYYLDKFRKPILRVETIGMEYSNPNHGSESWSHTKIMNEELAIGHFVKRRLIMPDRIIARYLRSVLAFIRRRPDRARMHLGFANAMLMANFKQPKRHSRYF